jgi:hypothetical protein
MQQDESSQELLEVNICEAQENYLSSVLKQRQAPVQITPLYGFYFIIALKLLLTCAFML